MTPIDPGHASAHIPHHHLVQLPESVGSFSLLLSQQTAEPPIEELAEPPTEPTEPTINPKPRKSRNQLQRKHRPADHQPAGKQRNN
jgi:hypothetical protein